MAKPWKESRWGAYDPLAFGYSNRQETGLLDEIPTASPAHIGTFLNRSQIDLIFKEDLWGSVRSVKDLEKILPGAINRVSGGDERTAQELNLPESFYGEFVKICEEIRGKCNFETLAELGEVYRRYYYKETLAYKDRSGKYYLDKPSGVETEPVETVPVGNTFLDFDGRDFNKLMAVTGLQGGAYGTLLSPLPIDANKSPLWSGNALQQASGRGNWGYGYGPQYALMWQFAQTTTYNKLVERLTTTTTADGTETGTRVAGTTLGRINSAFDFHHLTTSLRPPH